MTASAAASISASSSPVNQLVMSKSSLVSGTSRCSPLVEGPPASLAPSLRFPMALVIQPKRPLRNCPFGCSPLFSAFSVAKPSSFLSPFIAAVAMVSFGSRRADENARMENIFQSDLLFLSFPVAVTSAVVESLSFIFFFIAATVTMVSLKIPGRGGAPTRYSMSTRRPSQCSNEREKVVKTRLKTLSVDPRVDKYKLVEAMP
ncbi:hypothetical protein B0H63DRAFT_466436 [Podospora didyma]|uniref:Uncharacterized protein n=1 Tax=Podospora didyma TaxID=330526 RepID=A0AAE0NZU7_9PEZI|nr:hypothetical protein B0H63DRAFT_466436 [Podospora didyma]